MRVIRNNFSKVLTDVLSVDSWYTRSSADGSFDIFVDISFRSARIGGDNKDEDLLFDLAIRKAELCFFVEDESRAKIVKRTVKNFPGSIVSTEVESNQIHRSRNISGSAQTAISAGGRAIGIEAGYSLKANTDRNQEKTIESEGEGAVVAELHFSPVGGYRWEISPRGRDILLGRGWSRTDSLLSMKSDSKVDMERAGIRVEISCRQDDVVVNNLRTKTKANIWKAWTEPSPKRLVALQYIQKCLQSGGLEFRDVSNPYCRLTIGDSLVIWDEA